MDILALFDQFCVSADGSYIISGSEDNTIKIWDTKTKLLLNTLEG